MGGVLRIAPHLLSDAIIRRRCGPAEVAAINELGGSDDGLLVVALKVPSDRSYDLGVWGSPLPLIDSHANSLSQSHFRLLGLAREVW